MRTIYSHGAAAWQRDCCSRLQCYRPLGVTLHCPPWKIRPVRCGLWPLIVVVIIRPHRLRAVHEMRPVVTYVTRSVVCESPSVWLCELTFGECWLMWVQVFQIPTKKALFRGQVPVHCNVPTHEIIVHCSPAAAGECACQAHAVGECIGRREGWQNSNAAFCQTTFDTCYYYYYYVE